jgi:hypothetical protein
MCLEKRREKFEMSALLNELRQYYLDHQAHLAEKYGGKFIVLVDGGVFGVYATEAQAHQAAAGKLDLGQFIVQEVPTIEVD